MNGEAASWFISQLDKGDLRAGHAPEATKEWFENLELPLELLRFLQWRWPQKNCQIGPVSILRSNAIPKQESINIYLQHKLLPVGSGPNGDTFAIDYSVDSCPVGFVTHEEYSGQGDPRSFFCPAARSIESFLFRIVEDRYFPCDYYAASCHNDFLKAEASHEAFPPYAPRKA